MNEHALGYNGTTLWYAFQFLLLTLTAYRLQRIVTTDSWPPSKWFRKRIAQRFGGESSWAEFFTCPFCFGFWATLAVFALATLCLDIPLPVLQALAASAVVGLIGVRD